MSKPKNPEIIIKPDFDMTKPRLKKGYYVTLTETVESVYEIEAPNYKRAIEFAKDQHNKMLSDRLVSERAKLEDKVVVEFESGTRMEIKGDKTKVLK